MEVVSRLPSRSLSKFSQDFDEFDEKKENLRHGYKLLALLVHGLIALRTSAGTWSVSRAFAPSLSSDYALLEVGVIVVLVAACTSRTTAVDMVEHLRGLSLERLLGGKLSRCLKACFRLACKLVLFVLCLAVLLKVVSLWDVSWIRAQPLFSGYMRLKVVVVAVLATAYLSRRKASVYCMENVVFVPPKDWQVSKEELLTVMKAQDCFSNESLDFLRKVLERSGTGETTAWPPAILPSKDGSTKACTDIDMAREEAKVVIFPIVREALERGGVRPEQIDFLVINCSLFSPTPSLCAMVCNEFSLRENVRSYNLGGMGCSANVVAVDLAKQLLENQPGTRALVISTENLTQNLYMGNHKGMLLQNTLFRCGGSALLLSSRRADAARAKYKLLHTFRAHVSDDNSYNCVHQQRDEEGNVGIVLSKDIVKVAGHAMKRNFMQLGPRVLPLLEQARVLRNQVAIKLTARAKKAGWPLAKYLSPPQGYVPDFSKGIDHFCIHAGGRAVIEGVQKSLRLTPEQVKPSMQTLHDFGNTSSSSIWYEMDWVERHGGMRPGHRVLQIAFGSGFKCNSAVWVALRVDHSKVGVPLKDGA